MFTLLKTRKNISKTISILVLANKKIFLKNRILFNLFWIQNLAMTMPYIFRVKPSIFYTLIPVDIIERLNLAANTELMMLI